MRCLSCATENPATSRFCGSCAAPLAPATSSDAATQVFAAAAVATPPAASAAPPLSSSSSVDEGRFVPGTMLAGRYRIVGLLGRGGMGEVYRATDLTLGQVVALKFLPETIAADDRALARFYNEVRIARQVTHPNVCRVYDIGEVEGLRFISMEYVDGEDLGSLLRRIGRLPADKATETARKLCAGLAAAHEKGVLHRDLKPANIMIDGRGNVVIMDFGLAGLAEQVAHDVHSGTPAYMAPEQLAGREVTVRSDVYALGLLLYEIFSGRRAFVAESLMELMRMQEQAQPASLSSVVKDLDPAVERVVMRCLQPDPRQRPASVLAVAAALPGGDPLAAALAAGETPSPELVAAAGEIDGMQPRTAAFMLAGGIVLLLAYLFAGASASITEKMALDPPPEVLAHKASELARQFGYTSRPLDRAYSFFYDDDYFKFLQHHPAEARKRWMNGGAGYPALVDFWYRESPRRLVSHSVRSELTPNDPPLDVVGMLRVVLDAQGHLKEFEAVPPQVAKDATAPAAFDWSAAFLAAGLDQHRFQPAAPEWLPPRWADTRVAWTGSVQGAASPLRVEAASFQGRPVWFMIAGEWTHPARMAERAVDAGDRIAQLIFSCVLYGAIIMACFIARVHYRAGRVDHRGAFRIAAFAMLCFFLSDFLTVHHVPAKDEISRFWITLGMAAINPLIIWIFYLALEPWVRRSWPHIMIGWNRLMSAGPRDPLVGRDSLYGAIAGVMSAASGVVVVLAKGQAAAPSSPSVGSLNGFAHVLATVAGGVSNGITFTLVFLFVVVLLRALARRNWITGLVFTAAMSAISSLGSQTTWQDVAGAVFFWGLFVVVLLHFGMLSALVMMSVEEVLTRFPVTLDIFGWYGAVTWVPLALVLALLIYASRAALAGRRLLRDESL